MRKDNELRENGDGKNKKSVLKIIIAVLLVLVAVLLVAVGLLWVRNKKIRDEIDRADECLEEQKYEEALDAYENALDIMSTNAGAYLGMAKAYIGLGQYEDALMILEKGVDQTGSDDLEKAKELVYSNAFSTYVMNYYTLNLLRGEQKQLTIEPHGKDLNFEITGWKSSDDTIASVSGDGMVEALNDGMCEIYVNIGNETWGYRDIGCSMRVGVVTTFLEEQGCDYVTDGQTMESQAFVFQTDNSDGDHGERIYDGTLEIVQPQAQYILSDCTVSDPDADGNITYTATVDVSLTVKMGILPDSKEATHNWYYNWNVEPMQVADEYTGKMFYEQDLYGYDEPVVDGDVDFNDHTYHVFGLIGSSWDNEEDMSTIAGNEWITSFDEETGITWAEADKHGTYTYSVTVPKEYDGVVLILNKNGLTEENDQDYDNSAAGTTMFTDPQEDGTARSGSNYYVVRLSDYLEH